MEGFGFRLSTGTLAKQARISGRRCQRLRFEGLRFKIFFLTGVWTVLVASYFARVYAFTMWTTLGCRT